MLARLIALLALCGCAAAANLNPTVSWTFPTTNVDGTPIGTIDGTYVQWIRPGYSTFKDSDGSSYQVLTYLTGYFGGGGVFVPFPGKSAPIQLVCGKYWVITYVQTVNASIIGPTIYPVTSAPVSAPVAYDTGLLCPPSVPGIALK